MSFNLNGEKDADKDGAQTPWFGLRYARLFRTVRLRCRRSNR
jgi:hypothetical protein